jgi:chromate reductase
LQHGVDEADGLVIFTPEYNRSIPAVTKNAVDQLSRPHGDSALARSTVGIVAATPGNHRVAGVIDHLSASISANTPRLYDPLLGIGRIAGAVGGGRITDPAVRAELAAWLAGFVEHVRAVRRVGLVGADAGRRS